MIYKITTEAEWRTASKAGAFLGSADDRRDGYIHLSQASQVSGTAAKYFSGKPGLLLVAVEESSLGPDLKWEPSRGGDLFPHLYGPLPTSAARWVRPLPLGADGVPLLPEDLE